jgi:hypothetical protein
MVLGVPLAPRWAPFSLRVPMPLQACIAAGPLQPPGTNSPSHRLSSV